MPQRRPLPFPSGRCMIFCEFRKRYMFNVGFCKCKLLKIYRIAKIDKRILSDIIMPLLKQYTKSTLFFIHTLIWKELLFIPFTWRCRRHVKCLVVDVTVRNPMKSMQGYPATLHTNTGTFSPKIPGFLSWSSYFQKIFIFYFFIQLHMSIKRLSSKYFAADKWF